ncbi:protein of unknown function [Pseudonocardia ammonioxydans]|uniref:DUF4333 domain-containing protein n=1 Tax=Pseudonocardia ammonioxydans TaxID=260086 RepID=A0A1I4U4P5_PSUAM|nr:DUF4333 domain-containing protein [Pseudonocardia ammonioxydans]SFM83988.1 protein of unknown function [Pseudonocardia ammonioxydans]
MTDETNTHDGERSAMSNPQGRDRHPEDATERTGELPAWGDTPPGGWGADPAATGAWSPERDARDGWAGQGAADAGWDPQAGARDAGRDAGPGATGAWGPDDTGGWAPGATGGRAAQDTGSWAPQDTGGWAAQDPDGWAAPGTGGWAAPGPGERPGQEATAGWTDHDTDGWNVQGGDRPDAGDPGRTAQAAPVWGDEAAQEGDGWAIPTGRRRHRSPDDPDGVAPTDAVPAGSPASVWAGDQATTAQPADDAGHGATSWAPQESGRAPLDRRKWGLIGGGVLLVALVLASAFLWPAWAIPPRLDQTALQTGVNQVLSEDYGLEVGAVQCPDDVVVSAGTTFSCQAVVDGEQVEVPGVVTSDEGDYQVNRV